MFSFSSQRMNTEGCGVFVVYEASGNPPIFRGFDKSPEPSNGLGDRAISGAIAFT